jgi:hypothetical protein
MRFKVREGKLASFSFDESGETKNVREDAGVEKSTGFEAGVDDEVLCTRVGHTVDGGTNGTGATVSEGRSGR